MTRNQTPEQVGTLLDKEWRTYLENLGPLGEQAVGLLSNPQDPQLRQELYRFVFSQVAAGYLSLLHTDAEYPDFWPWVNQAFNAIAPNPDFVYYLAPLDGGGQYKISGYRGNVRMVNFTIAGGTLLSLGTGSLGPTYADYDLDKAQINAEDGSFEIILSANPPQGECSNWWKLDPRANHVTVRQAAYDWVHEIDARLAIERLDRPAIKPRRSADAIKENLLQIGARAASWSKFTAGWLDSLRDQGFVNRMLTRDLSSIGGVSTQKYVEGIFELDPDEVLIYKTGIPDRCRYWNIQLTDAMWGTIDALNRQSSLNGFTARLDQDGNFRAVISHTDPGVPNWLDTGGVARGVILARWTECSIAPDPDLTRIKLSDLHQHLPVDTPRVTPEERDAAIRLRRKGAQLRRRW